MRAKKVILLIALFTLLFTGCESSNRKESKREAATLNVFFKTNYYSGYRDNRELAARLQHKFPHLAFNFYLVGFHQDGAAGSALSYRELLAKGVTPDLILENVMTLVPQFVQEGLAVDQSAGVRSEHVDLGKFQPELLDHIRSWSAHGDLYALPYRSRLYALFYDKNQLQLSGVVLRNNMTWDEIDVAPLKDNLYLHNYPEAAWDSIESQYGLSYIDPVTQKAKIDTDSWRQALQLWQRMSESKADRQAMALSSTEFRPLLMKEWDMVSYPQLADKPGRGPNGLGDVIAVPMLSEHRQEAYEVMAYMVSDAFQLENARSGFPSVLDNKEVREQFGADDPNYAGKNVAALFALSNAVRPSQISRYDRSNWMLDPGSYNDEVENVLRLLASGMVDVEGAVKKLELAVDNNLIKLKDKIEQFDTQMQNKALK
ncbi:MAG: extracellular solute-binding protein [Paenibacillaceae bacterium]|nr:extracellular solute-binding protein [Paenibacillaceae bacterium]